VKGTTRGASVAILGLLVLFAGPLALGLLPAEVYWSEADHAALERASMEAHAAAFGEGSDALARRDAAQAELERHQARFKSAQASRDWLAIGCRGLGVLIAAGGVLLYARARRAEP
jgi:hypothetical protein